MIDLNRLDPQVILALNRLREPLFAAALKFFEDEEGHAKERLVTAVDTVQIHRLQGRSEAFADILQAVSESSKINP